MKNFFKLLFASGLLLSGIASADFAPSPYQFRVHYMNTSLSDTYQFTVAVEGLTRTHELFQLYENTHVNPTPPAQGGRASGHGENYSMGELMDWSQMSSPIDGLPPVLLAAGISSIQDMQGRALSVPNSCMTTWYDLNVLMNSPHLDIEMSYIPASNNEEAHCDITSY